MKQKQLIINELVRIVGRRAVLHTPEDLLVYEYDGSFETHPPDVVVLPRTTEQVSQIAKVAARYQLPLVARGAGTGLAGSAIPLKGGILIVLTRMMAIKHVDYRNRRAVAEAGVVNHHLVHKAEAGGYTYAPDPGSGKASTIGGNIATNAGGPHCLAYGVTANHILGLKIVLPDGQIVETGGPLADSIGYDLTGVIVGSEGTLGIVTEATAQLMPQAETVRTLLVVFQNSVESASAAVSDILAHGIVPTAMEMMDGMVCRAVEAAVHAGYPDNAAGVLLIEVEGLEDGLDDTMAQICVICRQHGASEVRQAKSAAERAALWTGRKSALGAMGRLAPNYYLEDGVVPRHKLPEVMVLIGQIAQKYDLPIGNFFHAGDGNIHPTILFDRRDKEATARAHKAAVEILEICIEVGGTVSGEHGIGTEKQDFLAKLYNQDDLDAMADLKACFNPDGRLNPGKIFPKTYQAALERQGERESGRVGEGENGRTGSRESGRVGEGESGRTGSRESGRGGEYTAHDKRARGQYSADEIASRLQSVVGSPYLQAITEIEDGQLYQIGDQQPTFVAQPASVEEVSALLRHANELNLAVSPWGGGAQRALGQPLARLDLLINMQRLNQVLEHYPSDLTAAIQAGSTLQAANEALAQVGQTLPLDAPLPAQATLGGIVATGALAAGLRRLAYGTVRDMLVGIQVVRPDGRVIRRGGMVVKNVAGYDMSRLQYGALGTLGIITQLNFKLQPQPEHRGAILASFADQAQAGIVVDNLMQSRLQPATIALFDSQLASQLKLNQQQNPWLFVRYEGREAAVTRQIRDTKRWMAAAKAKEIVSLDAKTLDNHWPTLVNFAQLANTNANQALLRLNVMPAEVINALQRLQTECVQRGFACNHLTDAALGVIWLHLTAPAEQLAANLPILQQELQQRWPQTVVAACPPEVKSQLKHIWGQPPAALKLMQTIKQRFDPQNLLNPGRFLF